MEVIMKYALLIYPQPGSFDSLPEREAAAITEEYMALREEPGIIDGAQLQDSHATTTVRVQHGEAMTTDGPFAETHEVMAGYYVVEAEDLDRALELAARIPAARMGGAVEVRPFVEVRAASGTGA
jgi:hypothetical protein